MDENILSEKDIENLEWARDFMNRYEKKIRMPFKCPRKPRGEFK